MKSKCSISSPTMSKGQHFLDASNSRDDHSARMKEKERQVLIAKRGISCCGDVIDLSLRLLDATYAKYEFVRTCKVNSVNTLLYHGRSDTK